MGNFKFPPWQDALMIGLIAIAAVAAARAIPFTRKLVA